MFLKKIDQMVSQGREKNANRSVLAQPLFVIMVGSVNEERRNAVRNALASRWQSAHKFINLCHINLNADVGKFDKAEHENMREIFMNIKSGSKPDFIKAQLSWWFFQLQGFVAKELGSLEGSHICVICDGESEASEWAAHCCMMLNYWISISGTPVSSRKFFCFLPEAPVSYAKQLEHIRTLCDSWSKSVPTEPMIVSFSDGKPKMPLRQANGVYPEGTKFVFDRFVFLDSFDTAQQICGTDILVPILMLLLDPALSLKWPGDKGSSYSAYLYPKYANRGIDVALTWRCLHDRYIADRGVAASDLDVNAVHRQVLSELNRITSNIPASLTGFTLYNGVKYKEFIGNRRGRIPLANLEAAIFGDVLKNKFDYIWIRELNGVRENVLGAWRKGMREQLRRVRDNELLKNTTKLAINYKLQPVQGSAESAVEQAHQSREIQKLIFNIGRFCYHEACQKKVDTFLNELNDEIGKLVKERAERIDKVRARADMENLGTDVANAVNAYTDQLGNLLANAQQVVIQRQNEIQHQLNSRKDIYDRLYSRYVEAIEAPEAEYKDMIAEVLELVFKSFDENWLNQITFPAPAVANCKVACRGVPVGTNDQDYVIDQITSGRSDGMYYYLMKIFTQTVSALNQKN